MIRFTTSNTENFTAAELATMNAAFDQIVAEAGLDGDEMMAEQYADSVADALNNAYASGPENMSVDDLVAAADALLGNA